MPTFIWYLQTILMLKLAEKEENQLKGDDGRLVLDEQKQVELTLRKIQASQQGLQECELSAINKRLKILHSSSAYFNMNFKFLKDVSFKLQLIDKK